MNMWPLNGSYCSASLQHNISNSAGSYSASIGNMYKEPILPKIDNIIRALALALKIKVEEILSKIPKNKKEEEDDALLKKRMLDNGGMAPPKLKNQIDVDNSEKNNLINEMWYLKKMEKRFLTPITKPL